MRLISHIIAALFYSAAVTQALACPGLLCGATSASVVVSAYTPAAVHLDNGTEVATTSHISADSCKLTVSFWTRTNWYNNIQVAQSSTGNGPLSTLPDNPSERVRGFSINQIDGSGWRMQLGSVIDVTAQAGWSASATTYTGVLTNGLSGVVGSSVSNFLEDISAKPPAGNPLVPVYISTIATYTSGTGTFTGSAASFAGLSTDTLLVDDFNGNQTSTPTPTVSNQGLPWAGVWTQFIYSVNVCSTNHQYRAYRYIQNQNGTIVNKLISAQDSTSSSFQQLIPFTTGNLGFSINGWFGASQAIGSFGDYADVQVWTNCDILNSGHTDLDTGTQAFFVNTTTALPVNPTSSAASMQTYCTTKYGAGTYTSAILQQGPASQFLTNQSNLGQTWTNPSQSWLTPMTDVVDSPAGIPAHKIALQWYCSPTSAASTALTTNGCGNRINTNDFLLVGWSMSNLSSGSNQCTLTGSTVSGSTQTQSGSATVTGSSPTASITVTLGTGLTAPTSGPAAMAGQFVGWGVTLTGFTGGTGTLNGTYTTLAGSTATSIIINPGTATGAWSSGTIAWATGAAVSTAPFVPWFTNYNHSALNGEACAAYKWADASEVGVLQAYFTLPSFTAQYTATFSVAGAGHGGIVLDYAQSSNGTSFLPIAIDAAGTSTQSTSSTSLVNTTISPTNSGGNDLLIDFMVPLLSFYGQYTCPAGEVQRAQGVNSSSLTVNSNGIFIVCEEIITAGGATGSRTVTQHGTYNSSNPARDYSGALLALVPN